MDTTRNNYLMNRIRERDAWLEECVQIVRDVVSDRRRVTRTMPDAIQQAALDLGLIPARTKSFFYREVLSVTKEHLDAMRQAALRECDIRARLLTERLEAAHARRRQYELELGASECGSSGPHYSGSRTGGATAS